MGTQIYDVATAKNHQVVCGIDKATMSNFDCPVYNDFDQINQLADVIVDFSSPSALSPLLAYATNNSIPLVIGATGHSKAQEKDVLSASKQIPIFMSSNTSFGVNYFIKLCTLATKLFNGYDVEIIEKHHKNKKDSPSGTTNLIYNEISKASAPLAKSQIHSLRGGTVVGDHSVIFLGDNESITLTHSAQSKKLFADGAIKACEFITTKKQGFYTMNDLI